MDLPLCEGDGYRYGYPYVRVASPKRNNHALVLLFHNLHSFNLLSELEISKYLHNNLGYMIKFSSYSIVIIILLRIVTFKCIC